jgi:archaellum component FlaG (FlaF/FlaG flagellin family)
MLTGNTVTFTTPGGNGELMPAQVGEIVVNTTISAGYNQLTVILNNGVTKNFEFQIQV